QFGFPEFPNLPNFRDLPTPEKFLETLFNVTTSELVDLTTGFDFEEILSEHVTFLLYKPDGSTISLNVNSDNHHININEPIKLVIHGWQSTGEQDYVKDFAKSYHAVGINNVLGVDWSTHSKKNYLHSARGTRTIGEIVGDFVMKVIKNDTQFLRNVHLIGHSLGAQVSGFAGKHIQKLTNGSKIERITGLDAASPLFEFPIPLPTHLRLNSDDANYVDGIHTNAGFMGFLSPYADADYYVDFGGPIQPGCANINIFEAFVCSHGKSVDIYNRTINSKEYLATACNNPLWAVADLCGTNKKAVMGEHTKKNVTGQYYINIDEENTPVKGLVGISLPRVLGLG
ncbi:hypothetical protein JTB14_007084, partial [Gonioctena quinquepunctata]